MQTNSARTELVIRGMNCANCARHVTEALQGVPGVASAQVDLQAARARVGWQGAAQVEALIEAVRTAGYEARVAPAASSDADTAGVRTWGANVLLGLVPTMVLMAGEWGWHGQAQPVFRWIAFGLATVVMAGPGRHFVAGALRQFKVRSANMDTLVCLGAGTAYFYSAAELLRGGHGHLYFMEAAAIVTLISLGHWIEARVGARASAALRALLQLAPATARRQAGDGSWVEVPVATLVPGDRIALKPGERVPTDAAVIEGASAVDESMLTGESMPVEKGPGELLYAGTLNQSGSLTGRVTGVGEDTALAHIIAAVQRAQASRAGIQRLADRVSSVFVPVVVLVALAAGLAWGLAPEAARRVHEALAPAGWHLAPPVGALAGAVFVVAAVLIVACPCAMGLATPAAIMAGANAAARRGILIRDGIALEKAGTLTAVLFDKTGTLTVGKPEVVFSEWLDPGARGWAAALAASSNHPYSRAVAAHCPGPPANVRDIREVRGAGVEARADAGNAAWIRLGSMPWLTECGVNIEPAAAFRARADREAATVVGLAEDGVLRALFAIQDTLKPGAAGVLRRLRAGGLKVALVTGDQPAVAMAIGVNLGLSADEVMAGVRPEAKAGLVRRLQESGERVAFVGDGLNDAPALEQADLGVAVSRASDVAREAADVVLLRSDIEAIPEALGLARATLRTIRQNLFWAFFYNTAAVPLAALGFMSPVLCALAMGLSDLIVIGNALRLRAWKGG